MAKIYLNNNWGFSPNFTPEMTSLHYAGPLEQVRLPHTVAVTPFNAFPTTSYQKTSLYRRVFNTEPAWQGKAVLLTIEGAAHKSEVYLNGKKLAEHNCGYTAFTVDLTAHLAAVGKQNVLAICVDSHESLNQPPFGFVIDYMTYGGIYRDVYLNIRNPLHIKDVFVHTMNKTHVFTEVKLSEPAPSKESVQVHHIRQQIVAAENVPFTGAAGAVYATADVEACSGAIRHTSMDTPGAQLWTLETPYLYTLVTELLDASGEVVDEVRTRFGFRELHYDDTGFFLNGKRVKIRGLNRHQAWPYIGYAMPKNMQREDADILKYELGVNEVRTSHYPQSHYFIDRCDEIGLLVFTELPGWQHIGDAAWKDQAVQNVHDMVCQYRNHPSIFIWGVRINESADDDEFYTRTNAVAHELDKTRPTGGVRCFQKSHLLEDVYTFNDFSCYGPNDGCLPKKKVTNTYKGYMITEYNGHMFPTKSFDNESHRTEHALRHAKVLDAVAARDEIAGASGWCMTDYNTHKDFGSGDYICYHGVMDMFRNPKLAAFVYQSQQEPEIVGDVLAVTSSMDIGEHPGGTRGDVYIITNADSVKMYVNDIFIKEYTAADSPFKHLAHGPMLVDDFIGHRLVDEEGIDEQNATRIKQILAAFQKYTIDNIPMRYRLKFIGMWVRGVINPAKMRKLYSKYLSNWGGESVSYKFEAYRSGELVKTVIKTAAQSVKLRISSRRQDLCEESTYDVAAVTLLAEDEHSNVQPYCQEAVTLRTEGVIELMGPKAVSLKGGMAGCYVKSCGKAGSGDLVVTDWQGIIHRLHFTVTV